eukprot:TRINITY_DN11329_c0_g1_i1.p1 TRINITY_DN11329_c0_g1~~TRINITY_DN11329_c0_g1_i1.p1  ORF type:complete len:169 (-),score=12.67 TRINITY_DN11329_c0_g1_i1:5-511(-)
MTELVPPDGFTIRPAVNGDCADLERIIWSRLREHGLQPDEDTDGDLKQIEEFYYGGDKPGEFLVVVDDSTGKVVGSCAIAWIDLGDNAFWELRKMYLEPHVCGKGLGRYLLLRILDWARNAGATTIWLETASSLTTAIAMYRKYGFVDTCAPTKGGSCRCDRWMKLDL